jgi:hypothetical protein
MRGRGCVIGRDCWVGVGDISKHIQTMPDVAGGGVRSPLGTLGRIWGGKLYILGVAGYNTPIWDVLALEGEREEAGERLYGAKLIKISQLGKRCQLGCSSPDLLRGSLGSDFHRKKCVLY